MGLTWTQLIYFGLTIARIEGLGINLNAISSHDQFGSDLLLLLAGTSDVECDFIIGLVKGNINVLYLNGRVAIVAIGESIGLENVCGKSSGYQDRSHVEGKSGIVHVVEWLLITSRLNGSPNPQNGTSAYGRIVLENSERKDAECKARVLK
jgi:hypothetical protein